VPEALLHPGPRGLLVWQWLGLVGLVAAAWTLGRLLGWLTRSGLGRIVTRTRTKWDDRVLLRVGPPLTLAWGVVAAFLLLPYLELPPRPLALANNVLRACLFLAFFWSLLRMVDVARGLLATSKWGTEHPAARGLLPIGARAAKVVVAAVAVTAIVSLLGYPVASLLAGLGIGGIALALAAQKTVENLFGAFSIGVDQPFREGDVVHVDGLVGTVEAIGLRSTRLRTADRTVVTIPNGKLAEMRVESLSARDRIRFACTVGLVYSSTAEQIRSVLGGIEEILRGHPKVHPDGIAARLKALGEHGLTVDVVAAFATTDVAEFESIRQEVLLSIVETVAKSGTTFALPARTVPLVEKV